MATYHIDEGAARHATKSPHLNLSYQTAKEAEEVAEKLAKKLNRAVNIYELDPDRKQEYGTIEPLRQHYALVYPDGKVKKSKDGVSPVVEYATEGDEDGKSLEEKLELPRVALGKLNSTLRTVDSVMAQMKRRGAPEAIRKRLHAVADSVANQIRAASPAAVEVNKRITAQMRAGDVFEAGLMRLEIASIDRRVGNMTVKLNRDPEAIWDAAAVARLIMGNQMRRVKAGPEEVEPTESHHLAPGDVALVDEDKKAFVLDAADGVYVVLLDGMVTTVEDDANRITPIDDALLPDARRVRRIWATFFKQALVRFNVKSVGEMDSDRKTKFFDFVRVKWPRVEKTMLNEESEEQVEEAPAPVEPEASEEKVASSKSQVRAWDPDEPDEGPGDYEEGVDPSEISSELLDMLHDIVKRAVPGKKIEIDPAKSDAGDFSFDVWTDNASMDDLFDKLQNDKSLKSAEMIGEGEERMIRVTFADDVVKDVDSSLSEGWDDPGDSSVPGKLPSQPSRKPYTATLQSFCMDICANDIEAATMLASCLTSSRNDKTKLGAMMAMHKYRNHDLPSGWFNKAFTLMKNAPTPSTASVSLRPPKVVQVNARAALELASKRGLVLPAVTYMHAKNLASGDFVSLDGIERMSLFFDRGDHRDNPLLFAAWGGEAGKTWVCALIEHLDSQKPEETQKPKEEPKPEEPKPSA